MAWPAQELIKTGHDIVVTFPKDRWRIGAKLDRNTGAVLDGVAPADADVIVVQRLTHRWMADSIPFWQAQGRKVVIDVDDDLSSVHAANPGGMGLRPSEANHHSHDNLVRACAMADVVTVTTPALAARYRPDAVILPNFLPDRCFLPDHFRGLERTDSTTIMWPASLATHPSDAAPLGTALEQVVRETGVGVRMLGGPGSAPVYRSAFRLRENPVMVPSVGIDEWPGLLASIGIGIAPLADTRFNSAKSHLKILELSACGVPWVASPRADYLRFHQETGAGILADRPNAWRAALKRLVTDDVFRKEQSEAVRAAAEGYRLRDHAWRFAEAWLS